MEIQIIAIITVLIASVSFGGETTKEDVAYHREVWVHKGGQYTVVKDGLKTGYETSDAKLLEAGKKYAEAHNFSVSMLIFVKDEHLTGVSKLTIKAAYITSQIPILSLIPHWLVQKIHKFLNIHVFHVEADDVFYALDKEAAQKHMAAGGKENKREDIVAKETDCFFDDDFGGDFRNYMNSMSLAF